MVKLPEVVVLGLSPTGLYAVREAARAGFGVVGVSDVFACGQFSKFVRASGRFWKIANHDELLARLNDFSADSEKGAVLVPTSDRFIEFVCSHRETLAKSFLIPDSYSGLTAELMDKRSFNRLCEFHGVETPGVWEAVDKDALLNLSSAIPYPCILKPELIHRAASFLRGKKVLLARDKDEYCSLVDALPEETGGWLVQEVIPGPESNITLFGGYFDQKSKNLHSFTARKLRQYPVGFGSASLVRSEKCSETLEKSIDFLEKVGFTGLCGTEFKRDPRDGKLKIIEINPRPTLWFGISHVAGKRFIETACRDMAGLPVPKEKDQADGVVWRYALKDFYSSLFYRFRGQEFIFPEPEIIIGDIPKGGRAWPVFSLSDPLPSFAEPLQFINKLTRRFRV